MGPEELEVFSKAKYYTSAWSPGCSAYRSTSDRVVVLPPRLGTTGEVGPPLVVAHYLRGRALLTHGEVVAALVPISAAQTANQLRKPP